MDERLISAARLFDAEGYRLLGVGGVVRNPLLGLPVSDTDVTSAMRPDDVIKLADKNGIGVSMQGAAFGMIELHVKGLHIEHTTFRADSYGDGGAHRPASVRFSDTPEEDALRRDFTVNAIYRDILTGEYIDPVGGMSDIKAGVIRATSPDPRTILSDDGLRILRMARFACELGFTVDAATLLAARDCVKGLADISAERVRDELTKLLLGDVRYKQHSHEPNGDGSPVLDALMLLLDIGALDIILPEVTAGRGIEQKPQYHRYDVCEHMLRVCACSVPTLEMRLAGLLHDIGKPVIYARTGRMYGHDEAGADMAKAVLSRLRFTAKLTRDVCALVRYHMYDLDARAKYKTLRKKFAAIGLDTAEKLALVREADVHGSGIIAGEVKSAVRWRSLIADMRAGGVPESCEAMAVTGRDIMDALDIAPSPRVGDIKRELFMHLALHPEDNDRQKLIKLAKEIYKNE